MASNWTFTGAGLGLPNQAYANLIPLYLLNRGFLQMVRMWDTKWEPVLQKVMHRMRADGGKSNFTWPLIVDPQPISDMMSPYGRVTYITSGADAEQWSTRKTAIGFMMEPEEFLNEFTPEANLGTSAKMQRLTQICVRSIERRIELELTNYLYGNSACITNFSNQLTNRLRTYDLTSSSNGMRGYSWNDYTNSDPFRDIDNAIEQQETMGDLPLNNLFVGTKTAKILKNHDVIITRLKFVRDMSGGTLQAFFGGLDNGMKVHKVSGNTYKENSANVGAFGAPGLGDMQADQWSNRNKYWFMRANGYEFAFMANDNLGFVFTSKCNQFHDGNGLYTYSWVDHEPHISRTRFEFKFAPGVGDFANETVLNNACPITA